MAAKSVVLDELDRNYIGVALDSLTAIITRRIKAEPNADIIALRHKELSAIAAAKSKVLA